MRIVSLDILGTWSILLDYPYSKILSSRAFIKKIQALSFNGVSGHINFTSGASRLTDIIVWQFQGEEYVEVGLYHPGSSSNDSGR